MYEPTTHDRHTEDARRAGECSSGLPAWEPDKCLSCSHNLHGQACDECLDNPCAAPKTAEEVAGELGVETIIEEGGG